MGAIPAELSPRLALAMAAMDPVAPAAEFTVDLEERLAADPVLVRLAASYFDTADRALAEAGWAMRVRLGGADEGWHLKERRSEGVREYSWPVSEEIPEAVLHRLPGVGHWLVHAHFDEIINTLRA